MPASEFAYYTIRDVLLAALYRRHKIGTNWLTWHGLRKYPGFRDLSRSQQEEVVHRLVNEGWLLHYGERKMWSLNPARIGDMKAVLAAEDLVEQAEDKEEPPEGDVRDADVPEQVEAALAEAMGRVQEELRRDVARLFAEQQRPTVVASPAPVVDLREVRALAERLDSMTGKVGTLKQQVEALVGVKKGADVTSHMQTLVTRVDALRGEHDVLGKEVREKLDDVHKILQALSIQVPLLVHHTLFSEAASGLALSPDQLLVARAFAGHVTGASEWYWRDVREGKFETDPNVDKLWVPNVFEPGVCIVCGKSVTPEDGAHAVPVLAKHKTVAYVPWLASVCVVHKTVAAVDVGSIGEEATWDANVSSKGVFASFAAANAAKHGVDMKGERNGKEASGHMVWVQGGVADGKGDTESVGLRLKAHVEKVRGSAP